MTAIARILRAAGLAAAGFFTSIFKSFQPATDRRARAFVVSFQGINMSHQNLSMPADDLEDEDDEDDFADDYGDLLGEDEWEDNPAAAKLYGAMPKGWVMVKVVNFTFRSMSEMESWLKKECRAKYEKVGFRSGCSYNVAVQFEDIVDATMFKLRWR
jgi:hypothetical protein